jgi:aminoglycoside phosphotransferase (APT) family kinase protein
MCVQSPVKVKYARFSAAPPAIPTPMSLAIRSVPIDMNCIAGFGDLQMQAQLRELMETAMGDREAEAVLTLAADSPPAIRMSFSTGRRNDGSHRLRHFYWSAQACRGDRFSARTLSFYRKDARPEWFDFPLDSALPSLPSVINGLAPGKVLRYIPLRRLTYAAQDQYGRKIVVKVKRKERIAEAARLLREIGEAVGKERAGFAVPEFLGWTPELSSMTQAFCEGDSLQDCASDLDEKDLEDFGAGLHELHRLKVSALAERTPREALDAALGNAEWLAGIYEPCAPEMAKVRDLLSKCAPDHENPVFCHGDLNASQLLLANGRWTFLDFDSAHLNSPCADIAKLAVKLQYDAPKLCSPERLQFLMDAVISGYARASGASLPRRSLNFHMACSELHNLQQMIMKGRFDASRFASGISRLHQSLEKAVA